MSSNEPANMCARYTDYSLHDKRSTGPCVISYSAEPRDEVRGDELRLYSRFTAENARGFHDPMSDAFDREAVIAW
jgi:hypothetical protein